jgi:hypothetical protein
MMTEGLFDYFLLVLIKNSMSGAVTGDEIAD